MNAFASYTFGFIAVIIARQQLFTENTLTVALPVMTTSSWRQIGLLIRLWGVVLAGNLIGVTLFALGLLNLHQTWCLRGRRHCAIRCCASAFQRWSATWSVAV